MMQQHIGTAEALHGQNKDIHVASNIHYYTLSIITLLPLMDFLSRFKSIVGIGVGAGAYILAKFAVSHILMT